MLRYSIPLLIKANQEINLSLISLRSGYNNHFKTNKNLRIIVRNKKITKIIRLMYINLNMVFVMSFIKESFLEVPEFAITNLKKTVNIKTDSTNANDLN